MTQKLEIKRTLPTLSELVRDLKELDWPRRWVMVGFLIITLCTFFFGFGLIENNWSFIGTQDLGPSIDATFMNTGSTMSLGAWWVLRTLGLVGALLIIPTNILWISGKRSAFLLAIPQAIGFLCQYVSDGMNLNFLLQLTTILPFLVQGLLSWTDDTIKVKRVGIKSLTMSLILLITMFGIWLGIDVLINGWNLSIGNSYEPVATLRGLDIATNVTTTIAYINLIYRERLSTPLFTINDIMTFLIFSPLTVIGFSSLHINISILFFLLTKVFDYYYWWFKLKTEEASNFIFFKKNKNNFKNLKY